MRRPARARYAWPAGRCGAETTAPLVALQRAFALRRAPAQGRALQSRLLAFDRKLARRYARTLSHLHAHVVVSQTLLPHLWAAGALAGRSFDVLVERWPMTALEARLDGALGAHPESPTLGDFRAPPEVVAAETEALAAAERLLTPHRAIAASFGDRAVLLDWALPAAGKPIARGGRTILFPASALGRKGAYELRAALSGLDAELVVAGGATEHDGAFWDGLKVRRLDGRMPERLAAVVLPAVIEHQPRALLRALAAGIPVIATPACGFGERPGVVTVPELDAAALREALERVLIDSILGACHSGARAARTRNPRTSSDDPASHEERIVRNSDLLSPRAGRGRCAPPLPNGLADSHKAGARFPSPLVGRTELGRRPSEEGGAGHIAPGRSRPPLHQPQGQGPRDPSGPAPCG